MENQTKKSKKGLIIFLIIIILLAGSAAVYWFWFRKSDGKVLKDGRVVYVQKVDEIVNSGYVGLETRFMGIVESQETKSVNKDSSKTVKEIFVKVGDSVKEGDELFVYDTQEMELQLEQMNLDLQGIYNNINSTAATIDDLVNQRDKATSEDERLSLTSQINSYNASLNEANYSLSIKQLEIQKQEESIKQAAVTAPMDGMIKSINQNSSSGYGPMGTSGDDGFITIIAEGDFRIKGTVSEQNIRSLNQGTPILIRSRVSDDVWHGVITKIDLEPQKNEGDSYYYMMGPGDSASKYSFYVNPDSTDGLMLGQHLYLEIDNGQSEVKQGLYLPSYYMMLEEGGYFVWKQVNDHIEKTEVSVGEYDENTDSYEIKSGITEEDFIAYPDYYIENGCPTTTNYDEYMQEMMDDPNGGSVPGGPGDDMGGDFGIGPGGDMGGDFGIGPGDDMGGDYEISPSDDVGGDLGGDENIEFSTDYLTDEELMQDIDPGMNDNAEPKGE